MKYEVNEEPPKDSFLAFLTQIIEYIEGSIERKQVLPKIHEILGTIRHPFQNYYRHLQSNVRGTNFSELNREYFVSLSRSKCDFYFKEYIERTPPELRELIKESFVKGYLLLTLPNGFG